MSPEVLVEAQVEMLLDWNFDVLLYDMQQLIDMAVNVFDFFHLIENFGIPRAKLRAFVTTVRALAAPAVGSAVAALSAEYRRRSMKIHLRGSLTPSLTSLAWDGGAEQVLNMYQDAPFHNFHHAFHVFQNSVLFLCSVPELQQSLSSLDAFSLLVASLCHDMDHTGACALRPDFSAGARGWGNHPETRVTLGNPSHRSRVNSVQGFNRGFDTGAPIEC